MDTKPEHKKGAKRPFKKLSLLSKSDQVLENVAELKKKAKIDNTIHNGNPVPKTKVQMLQKIGKQMKKQKHVRKQDDDIEKLSEAKVKKNVTISTVAESKEKVLNKAKEKKLEHLKNKQLIREMNKAMPRQEPRLKTSPETLDPENLKTKLAEIMSREVLSKSARKKIRMLRRKIQIAEDESKELGTIEDGKNKQANVFAKNKQNADIKDKRKAKEEGSKKKKVKVEEEDDAEDDDDVEDQSDMEEEEDEDEDKAEEEEEEVEEEVEEVEEEKEKEDEDEDDDEDEDEEEEEEEEENSEEEEEGEEMNISQGKADTESDEDEEDSDEQDNEEELAMAEVKKKKEAADQLSSVSKKEQRALFVGNLPFT